MLEDKTEELGLLSELLSLERLELSEELSTELLRELAVLEATLELESELEEEAGAWHGPSESPWARCAGTAFMATVMVCGLFGFPGG